MRRLGWAVLVLALLAAGCAGGAGGASTVGAATGGAPSAAGATGAALPGCPPPGRPATGGSALPDLSLPCLGGGGPATVPLRRLTGQPTVLNLWASWCGPCRAELPALARLARTAGDRLRVVGVASQDVPANALSFAVDNRLPFPSLQDRDGDLARGLRRVGLPVTVLVRADGTVAYVYQGAPLTDTTLRALLGDKLGVHV